MTEVQATTLVEEPKIDPATEIRRLATEAGVQLHLGTVTDADLSAPDPDGIAIQFVEVVQKSRSLTQEAIEEAGKRCLGFHAIIRLAVENPGAGIYSSPVVWWWKKGVEFSAHLFRGDGTRVLSVERESDVWDVDSCDDYDVLVTSMDTLVT